MLFVKRSLPDGAVSKIYHRQTQNSVVCLVKSFGHVTMSIMI